MSTANPTAPNDALRSSVGASAAKDVDAHAAAMKKIRAQRAAALIREVELVARSETFGGLGCASMKRRTLLRTPR